MALNTFLKGSRKGQMMSLAVLLVFILMLAGLFSLVILNVQYNNIAKAVALSTSSTNIGRTLQLSSGEFARDSLRNALATLTAYEYNASLRHGNFITNLSAYLSSLMVNGTMPKVTPGSMTANVILFSMRGLTFNSYNASIVNKLNITSGTILINQTRPVISQYGPYSLSVSYLENVVINQSGVVYKYNIPVNASIPLNNTPDLFYTQGGALEYMRFYNLNNLTTLIGNARATAGSQYGFAYGTVNVMPGGGGCPSGFSPPSSYSIIIATSDASGMNGCENSFAGLITSKLGGENPTVPYLAYPSSVNIASYLISGEDVLLYGPELSTLNIENLRNAVSDGYYFASPFASSYIGRAAGNLPERSQNGIFALSNFNREVARFNGATSQIVVTNAPLNTVSGGNNTVALWLYWTGGNNQAPFSFSNYNLIFNRGCFGFDKGSSPAYGINNSGFVNRWIFVVAKLNNGGGPIFNRLYINGVNETLGTSGCIEALGVAGATDSFSIGNRNSGGSGFFNGMITNVQMYNTSLSPLSIERLYQEGLSAIPISGNNLVFWSTLNGNLSDISGNNDKVSASSVAFSHWTPAQLAMPVADFNGTTGYISFPSTSGVLQVPITTTGMTISTWFVLNSSQTTNEDFLSYNGGTGCGFDLFFTSVTAVGLSDGCNDHYDLSGPSGAFLPNVLYNLIVTVAPSRTETYYVNGVQLASGAPASWSNSYSGSSFNIGFKTGYVHFNGVMANIQIYNATLSASQAAQIYSAGISGGPVQTSNLVGWWRLDGNANDYSGLGTTGSPNSMGFTTFRGTAIDSISGSPVSYAYPIPGILSCTDVESCYNATLPSLDLGTAPLAIGDGYAQAASFNGVGSYIEIPHSTALDGIGTGTATVSAWVRTSALTGTIFSSRDSSHGYQLLVSGTEAAAYGDVGGQITSTTAINDGAWHHVVAVWNGANVQIYVDGTPASGGNGADKFSSSTFVNQMGALCTGAGRSSCSSYFNGNISNVQVYNVPLTSGRVSLLYSEGISGLPIQRTGLVGWWPLNGDCIDYSNEGGSCDAYTNVIFAYLNGTSRVPGLSSISNTGNEWQALGFGVPPR